MRPNRTRGRGQAPLILIATSAVEMPNDAERLLKQGFNACLSKPYRREDLQHAAEEALMQVVR
jgi:CheY-like chemotaxis protein